MQFPYSEYYIYYGFEGVMDYKYYIYCSAKVIIKCYNASNANSASSGYNIESGSTYMLYWYEDKFERIFDIGVDTFEIEGLYYRKNLRTRDVERYGFRQLQR